jgi:hypothetical protein
MFTYPSVDESFDRLHRAGWSIGETTSTTVWIVTGTNGENRIHAEGGSQAAAWHLATLQAEAVGMLASARPTGLRGRMSADG